MATGQTIGHNLPYPLSTDPVNVHGDIKALADRLEIVISAISSLPSQTGNAGKFLKTDGFVTSWATASAAEATPSIAGIVYGKTDSSLQNVALGYHALNSVTTGTENVALGPDSLVALLDGFGNVGVGSGSLGLATTGSSNIGIGSVSAAHVTTGSYNIGIGRFALDSVNTGSYNIAIGRNAGNSTSSIGSGNNNILIGYNAQTSSSSISNEITLGNTDINRLRIPGMGIDWKYLMSESAMIGGAAGGTLYFNAMDKNPIRYYQTNATSNWTLDIRGDASTTFNSLISQGKSMTIVVMAQQGPTAYYPTAITIDGNAITPRWQGGSAPTSGNANSIDIYTYTIIKVTHDATPYYSVYAVLASQTKFA